MDEAQSNLLPEDLLIEILARLPVRSLIRFKCVCKSWFSLINSREFATKHLTVHNCALKNDFDYLLIRRNNFSVAMPVFCLLSYDMLNISHTFECEALVPRVPDGLVYLDIVGPCNGIFCLLIGGWGDAQVLLLWNPATREVMPLEVDWSFYNPGFGFDPITDDYKVVVTSCKFLGDPPRVHVYSLRHDSWRNIDASYFFDGSRDFHSLQCVSNERMCNWLGWKLDSGREFLISFDSHDEVFLQTALPLPQCEVGDNRHHLVQQQSNKCHACLMCVHGFLEPAQHQVVDIWLLDESGVAGSWNKQHSVRFSDDYVQLGIQVGLWKGSQILIEHQHYDGDLDPELVSYDPATEQVRFTGVRGWLCSGYTESLVSIRGQD
ncbi:hypothetical protein Ancab_022484 [Ancistrocladus abbreviatus]